MAWSNVIGRRYFLSGCSKSSTVRAQEPLNAGTIKVDDAELQAEVARLEAEMDLANQALERTRELLNRNASSAADLERAEATARSTRSGTFVGPGI